MARRDVVSYYLEVENQYFEMLDNLKDFKEMADENVISQEDYLKAVEEVEVLKTNYERIGYIIFLLNKPNRKSKKPSSIELSWYKALKYDSKEAILDENRDVLCKLKELLKLKKEKSQNENKWTYQNNYGYWKF